MLTSEQQVTTARGAQQRQHDAATRIQRRFLRHVAYSRLSQGSFFERTLPDPSRRSYVTKIRAISTQNVQELTAYLSGAHAPNDFGAGTNLSHPMDADERAFLVALQNAPLWLTHYTDADPETLGVGGHLMSHRELERHPHILHPPGGGTSADEALYNNLSFVFFRLEVGQVRSTESRFGKHLFAIDACETSLVHDGWMTLFDQMEPFPTVAELRRTRTAVSKLEGTVNLLYTAGDPPRSRFVQGASIIFHGQHVRRGLALAALFELRLGCPQFRHERLQPRNLTPAQLGQTIQTIFRPEVKIPRRVNVRRGRWLH